jgi:sensor histidine kinase YesM
MYDKCKQLQVNQMLKNVNAHAVIFSLAIVLALATASECHSITYLPSLIYGAVLWGWWACVASAFWKLGQRINYVPSLSLRSISIHILTGAALGVLHLVLLGSVDFTVPGWETKETALSALTNLLNINRLGMELLLYGFLFGITGVIQSQIRAQREAMQSLELQRQLSVAHLRALQMQLEPHFLFNTLNAITTLVELGRQKPAAEMLRHLNSILKSTLTRTTPQKVPLAQELEFVGNYLAIEQVRFADRLRVQIDVDPGAVDGLVPCFLLQPIVENAIRHGIANCENEGLVEASATRIGDSLHVLVRDSGPVQLDRQQNGHGIGLKNTRERLAHFYPGGYRMMAQPLHTGGFEVAITIPYERDGV